MTKKKKTHSFTDKLTFGHLVKHLLFVWGIHIYPVYSLGYLSTWKDSISCEKIFPFYQCAWFYTWVLEKCCKNVKKDIMRAIT